MAYFEILIYQPGLPEIAGQRQIKKYPHILTNVFLASIHLCSTIGIMRKQLIKIPGNQGPLQTLRCLANYNLLIKDDET